MADPNLNLWVALFLAIALYLLVRHWRDGAGVGLLIGYVLSFSALHWLAASLYLLPWFWNARLPLTLDGLKESTYALFAFAAGAEAMALLRGPVWTSLPLTELPTPDQPLLPPLPPPSPVDPRLASVFLIVGVVMYAVVLPISGLVPSLTAVASAGSTLALAGIALKCWNGWQLGSMRTVLLWLGACVLMPWLTVITQGFLGYGFAAMLTVFTFVGSFYRPRWKFVAAGVLLAYLGLSVYVTYMRDRREIREVVWTNQQMTSRFDRLATTVGQAEWFSIWNVDHLDRIEKRLNQDSLVGAAIDHLKQQPNEFANGETLGSAAAAIIPRALWPEKPVAAGSGDLVSRFTGIKFNADTSVGIGQVMEWYVNFGTAGIFVGFFIIGALVVFADRMAAAALRRQDAAAFAVWFLPGLSLLQVGGSFVDITSTAAAGLLVAAAIGRMLAQIVPASQPPMPFEEPVLASVPPPAESEPAR